MARHRPPAGLDPTRGHPVGRRQHAERGDDLAVGTEHRSGDRRHLRLDRAGPGHVAPSATSPPSAAPSAVPRRGIVRPAHAGGLDQLRAGHLPEVDDAPAIGGHGQVGGLAGLGGQRGQMRAGQLVQRVGAQAGRCELAQAGAGVVVTVLVAAHELLRGQRGEQA